MFGFPGDSPWIWLGLVVVAATMSAVVLALPAAPPDAGHLASTVDEVAASQHATAASVELRATEITIGPQRIAVRGPGGTARSGYRYGPVTPVPPDSPLEAVADGTHPRRVFENATAFRQAVTAARSADPDWHAAGSTLRVRRVRYGEVNCVLVDA